MFLGRNIFQQNGEWVVFYSGQFLRFPHKAQANRFWVRERRKGAEYYDVKDDLSLQPYRQLNCQPHVIEFRCLINNYVGLGGLELSQSVNAIRLPQQYVGRVKMPSGQTSKPTTPT